MSVSGANGQEFAIIDREDGEWFGEPCLVDDEPRVIDARVIVPSDILVIPRSVVRNIAEQYPIIYKALFAHTFRNTRGLYQLVAGILFSPLRRSPTRPGCRSPRPPGGHPARSRRRKH